LNLRLLLASSVLGLSLVACNGGGSAPSPTGQSIPTGTQSGSSTVYTSAISSAVQSATGVSSATIGIPTSAGAPAGVLGAPAAAPPSGVSTLSLAKSGLTTQSSTVANGTALIYIPFTPSSNYTLPSSSTVSFTFGLVSPSTSSNYHVAFYNDHDRASGKRRFKRRYHVRNCVVLDPLNT
jgi:hypothetical protein